MSKYELVVLVTILLGVGLPALIFMYFSRCVSTRPSFLFLCGLLLVLLGAHGFDLLISLQTPIANLVPSGDLTKEIVLRLEHQRQLWLFLFPSVVAAVGVNLMSTAITYRSASIPELEAAIARLETTTERLEAVTRYQYVALIAFIIISVCTLIYRGFNA